MEKLEIIEVFTEDDVKFNRKMVDLSLSLQDQRKIPGQKTKRKIQNQMPNSYMRDVDCTKDIVEEFRRKWGLN